MRHLLLAGFAVAALTARANVYITPVVTVKMNGRAYVTTTLLRNGGPATVKCESTYASPNDPGGTLRTTHTIEPGAVEVDEATPIEVGAIGTIRFDCSGPLLIAAHMQASRDGGKTFDSERFFRSVGDDNPVTAGTSRSIKAQTDLLMMEVKGKSAQARVVVKDREGRVWGQTDYEITPFGEQIVNFSLVRVKITSPVVEISVKGAGAVVITSQSEDASLAALFKRNARPTPLMASAAAGSAGLSATQLLGVSAFKAAPFIEPMTGLIYMRRRWYDPHTGTFLTPDPSGYADSANLYSYCGGDPVNCKDPTGEISLKAALTDGVINEYEMSTLALTDEEIRTIIGSQDAVKLAGPDDTDRNKHNLMRAKFILLARNQAFKQYAGQLYELTRGVNPVQVAAETGWAIGSGYEPIMGNKANRGDKVLELATYLAFMKGSDYVLGRLRVGALPPRVVSIKKPPLVIGEDVQGRVAPYARSIGADYYLGAGDNVPKASYLEHNRQTIRAAMDEGREIIDIGPSPSRANYPVATSPSYAMELDEIARAHYRNYVRQPLSEPERFTMSNAH